MYLRSSSLACIALSVLCAAGLAYIHPNAPASAVALETSSTAAHDYMHDNYPSSYGSHGMEDAAANLNDGLFDWEFNLATECDIEPLMIAADDAFADMTGQWLTKGIFLDPAATAIYYDIYFDLGVTDFYLSFLNCVPPHSTTQTKANRVNKRAKANGSLTSTQP